MRRDRQVRISVIVTVHNAEKYLQECLDSVMAQTFSDIEILCMDGGSTDASPQILRDCADKDGRLRIVNDPNTSYGHKVNQGIRLARGEYISVLESDDMYFPDMLERLYEIAQQYHPDFVNANYLEFGEAGGRRYHIPVKMYPQQDYNRLLESGKHPEDMRQILRYWTGIFKREFLVGKEIWMNESPGASFQDMSFRFLTSALADTSYHLDALVYLYRTDNPLSSVCDPKKAVVIADEFQYLKKELDLKKVTDPSVWKHFYTWKYNDFYGNLIRFDRRARASLLERCFQEWERDRTYLVQNHMRERSKVIEKLSDKSRRDLSEEIEATYQKLREDIGRREQLYRRLQEGPKVIWGCGAWGKNVLAKLEAVGEESCCFVDNRQELWGSMVNGSVVLSPGEAMEQYSKAQFIVANKLHAEEIVLQLRQMGIEENKICVY